MELEEERKEQVELEEEKEVVELEEKEGRSR